MWKQRYRGYRLALIGVTARHRDTLLGARVTTAALAELRRRMSARGAEEIIVGWIVESNHATIRLVETFGFQPSRTYGVYERNLIG
jgi:L-amino acid N-acyltransferase YncA